MDIKTVAIKKLIGQNIRTLAELKGPLVISQIASSISVLKVNIFQSSGLESSMFGAPTVEDCQVSALDPADDQFHSENLP